jgi:hypothetical protein
MDASERLAQDRYYADEDCADECYDDMVERGYEINPHCRDNNEAFHTAWGSVTMEER